MYCGWDLKQHALFKLTFLVQPYSKYFENFVGYFFLSVRLIYIKNIYCHILGYIKVHSDTPPSIGLLRMSDKIYTETFT
jgi:hypothetical protein